MGEDKKKHALGVTRKVRFKDKTFVIGDLGAESDDSGSDVEVVESFEDLALFVGKTSKQKNPKREEKENNGKMKYKKKQCPLKCPKEYHTNGSLYFCMLYRAMSRVERKLLQ